jgi:signal transduction histidine kinase
VITTSSSVEELRSLPLFEGLHDDVLEWLLAHGEVLSYAHDEMLVDNGSPATHMFVLLEGTINIHAMDNGRILNAITYTKGIATGLLPYSRMTTYPVRVVAGEPVRLLRVPREHFPEMVHRSPELGQRLVGLLSDRVREQTRVIQQRDKMMALGKLSAGLAHELNNPAAAIKRSADALRDRFHVLKSVIAPIVESGITIEHIEAIKKIRMAAFERGATDDLSTLERGRREDDLGDWLESRGVPEAWRLAGTYVDVGITTEELDQWAGILPKEGLPAIFQWLEASLSADRILSEIATASDRISELVAAVKGYSHMDSMPDKQPVDVREGLDSTLIMMKHEIKKRHIEVERDYDPQLPKLPAYAGELNQVWTNLIDNAIDAVPAEGGKLKIQACREDHVVAVRIIDNGHGIAPEAQGRIFDPFFSTKPVGEGTGLGLDIAQRIVAQHGGRISVESKPGETAFTVYLPLENAVGKIPAIVKE